MEKMISILIFYYKMKNIKNCYGDWVKRKLIIKKIQMIKKSI